MKYKSYDYLCGPLGLGTRIANVTCVALTSYAMVGATGAASAIAN